MDFIKMLTWSCLTVILFFGYIFLMVFPAESKKYIWNKYIKLLLFNVFLFLPLVLLGCLWVM